MSNFKKIKNRYNKPAILIKKLPIKILFKYDLEEELFYLAQCIPECQPCVRSCFLAGTKISTDEGFKKIENIKKDNVVLSFNFSKFKLTPSKVKEVMVAKEKEYLIINNNIKVTPFHRFWTEKKKWIKAKDLKLGDKLFSIEKKWIIINSIKNINEEVTVYNLHLYGIHKNFFAEGVLVHNYKCL